MNELLVLQGIPASGKSTWAKEFIKGKEEQWIIVNRDSIRESTGKYWVPTRENWITLVEEYMIRTALRFGNNVIIDATNLNSDVIKKWKNIAQEENAKLTFKYFNISLLEAIERDKHRSRSVGENVIKKFFYKYYNFNKSNDERFNLQQNKELPQAIIVDIDGTLSLMHNRNPFEYHLVDKDLPNWPVIDLINTLSNQYQIIIATGREGTNECLEKTKSWLKKYLYTDNYILLHRKEGDYRKDAIVKQELYNLNIKDKYYIVAVFDDRKQCVDMWRSNGLLCNQVYDGNF